MDFSDKVSSLITGYGKGRVAGRIGWPAGKGGVGPDPDEALEVVVGDEVLRLEDLHRGRTRVVTAVEPPLDARPVVGHAGAEAHRGFHHV